MKENWDGGTEKPILKKEGYYYSAFKREGKKPEDMEDVDPKEVERIAQFLRKHPVYPRRKGKKYKFNWESYYVLGGSYGLKHVVEEFIGYITNGEFIAAAEEAGLLAIPGEDSPNASIYIPCERMQAYTKYFITV